MQPPCCWSFPRELTTCRQALSARIWRVPCPRAQVRVAPGAQGDSDNPPGPPSPQRAVSHNLSESRESRRRRARRPAPAAGYKPVARACDAPLAPPSHPHHNPPSPERYHFAIPACPRPPSQARRGVRGGGAPRIRPAGWRAGEGGEERPASDRPARPATGRAGSRPAPAITAPRNRRRSKPS